MVTDWMSFAAILAHVPGFQVFGIPVDLVVGGAWGCFLAYGTCNGVMKILSDQIQFIYTTISYNLACENVPQLIAVTTFLSFTQLPVPIVITSGVLSLVNGMYKAWDVDTRFREDLMQGGRSRPLLFCCNCSCGVDEYTSQQGCEVLGCCRQTGTGCLLRRDGPDEFLDGIDYETERALNKADPGGVERKMQRRGRVKQRREHARERASDRLLDLRLRQLGLNRNDASAWVPWKLKAAQPVSNFNYRWSDM